MKRTPCPLRPHRMDAHATKSHGVGARVGCSNPPKPGTQRCCIHSSKKVLPPFVKPALPAKWRSYCIQRECLRKGRGKVSICARHGGGKRCLVVECTRLARGKTDYCADHGGGRRCACGNAVPSFGLLDGKPTHCAKCKTGEMLNVVSNMCEGCLKTQPSFGLDGPKE